MTGVVPEDFVPVATTSRSNVDESVHFGCAVGLDASGSAVVSAGNPGATIYPRSSTKPLQALAMVRAGLAVPSEHLAVVCSSHNGEPMHLEIVRSILASAGLDESALGNTAGHPYQEAAMHSAIRSGTPKSALQMNCSGKHAGMLATCVVNGWPLEGYLHEDHPLQRAVTATVAELTGAEPVAIGVDGCGAPAHVVRLDGLAGALRAMATGGAGSGGTEVHVAMSSHPDLVGGTGRCVTALMKAVPGLMAKDGAESVYVAAHPDGRAAALKISDGSGRAAITVMVDLLGHLGFHVPTDVESLVEPVLGHGAPVGRVRCTARW